MQCIHLKTSGTRVRRAGDSRRAAQFRGDRCVATCTSKRSVLLSVAPILLLPDIGKAIKSEFSLLAQEVEFYKRQAVAALSLDTPVPVPSFSRPPLNADLAQVLLEAPLQAALDLQGMQDFPPLDSTQYERDVRRLQAQELPYFQQANACGACGKQGLSDAAWFDFQAYIRIKALSLQLGSARRASSQASAFEYMHRGSPEILAQEGLADGWEGEAVEGGSRLQALREAESEAGERPTRPVAPPAPIALVKARVGERALDWVEQNGPLSSDEKELLELRTSQLDVIRAGVRVLLRAMQDLGLMAGYGLSFFGASKYEARNHEVWVTGEPAFVRVWVDTPATLRSDSALQAEEGFSQDFIYTVLSAHLERCGVACSTFRRFPSMTAPQLVTEQWTITCRPPWPPEEPTGQEAVLLASLPEFQLDACPGDAPPSSCY